MTPNGRIGRAARAALYGPRPLRLLAGKARPRALVLTYHRVGTPADDPWGQAVSTGNFEAQLRVLHERYRVAALEELLDAPREGHVAVTFDDGYSDTLSHAAPIAADAGVPIHVFVAAGPVLDGGGFWWDDVGSVADGVVRAELHSELKRLGPAERLRRLEATGVAGGAADDAGRPLTLTELGTLSSLPHVGIGSHTVTHPSLAARPLEEQRRELEESRTRLTQAVGRPIETLSYPFGKQADVTDETRALAAEVGYAAAFTSTGRPVTRRSPRYAVPRLTAHDWNAAVFTARIRSVLGY